MTSTASVDELNEDIVRGCGKVYLNKNNQVVFGCELCEAQYKTYKHFIQHISEKHFKDCLIIKIVNVTTEEKTNTHNETHTAEPTNEPEDSLKCCGKIYLNMKNQVAFDCELCEDEEQLKTYKHFIQHFSEKHFNDCRIIKTINVTKEKTSKHKKTPSEKSANNKNANVATNEPQVINVLKKRTKLKDTKDGKERIHICEICSASFADKSYYTSHMRRHRGEKKYACEICPKLFFTRVELRTHMCSHTGERPFVCATCGKRFLTSGHLTGHMLRHTNERPYKCKHCDKRYYGGAELKEHLLTHFDERKYVCKICNASFHKRSVHRGHMKIHANKREYVCKICNAAFNQGPALNSHMKSHGERINSLILTQIKKDTN